jgi:hypothetical protein
MLLKRFTQSNIDRYKILVRWIAIHIFEIEFVKSVAHFFGLLTALILTLPFGGTIGFAALVIDPVRVCFGGVVIVISFLKLHA